MNRLEQISHTIQKLESERLALDSKLGDIQQRQDNTVNDLSIEERELTKRLESIRAEREPIERKLLDIENQISMWNQRLNAYREQEVRNRRQEQIGRWNGNQQRVYKLALEYNAHIHKCNELRERMIEKNNDYKLDLSLQTVQEQGGKRRPDDVLPQAVHRMPQTLAPVDVYEERLFERFIKDVKPIE